ncbi:hypothetical protein FRACYDRAFT_268870 [Fragilariopsis cylindrus CCMP1102]|uniref:Helicase-associated domain-containing protein n=1 Tax=Fragilariopsis cylindrus CCMP1102 TaxID=635003 RepID=A0A1E7FJ17_9STRA|nr:hypothetical protein FRACYDRAFT_268870 [Fragilariopsis cylindrus CCMP1102]|eukprot:OEU18147.1 hypothetical protein FRACYDRAFT_268870 [Fragilariopsis cylindrus CCMP1102]
MKKKDKENSKDDSPPTNRKRTRDQSEDEESCDDSNIDDEIDDEEDPRKDNDAVCNPQKDNRNDEKWMRMFEKLVAYKNQHNNTMVPQKYKKDPKLGPWVSRLRRAYRNDKLLPNRYALLNSIAFDWDGIKGKVVTDQMIWMNMFQKLVAYKNQHKTTFVPVKNDPKLGRWVNTQRLNYKNDLLHPGRFDLLNSIDFTWNGNNRYICMDY